MKTSNLLKKIVPYASVAVLLAGAHVVNVSNEKPLMFVSKQDQTINFDSTLYRYFSLGLKRLISSTLWVSTIIESDIEHYKQKDLNSWMFLRFNIISELEPEFYENYAFGGVYLSIIKDDIPGATIIFNKGLQKYPTDYPLLRDASYHFFFEAKDYTRAYQITQSLKKHHPQKLLLVGMITKLEAEHGKLEEALTMLNEFQNNFPRGTLIGDKVFLNRYALKAEMDLNCLNIEKRSDCPLSDLEGVPYIRSAEGFKAAKEWIPYRRKSITEKK